MKYNKKIPKYLLGGLGGGLGGYLDNPDPFGINETLKQFRNQIAFNPPVSQKIANQKWLADTNGIKTIKDGVVSAGIGALSGLLGETFSNALGNDTDIGRITGTLFSLGVSSASNTLTTNLMKNQALTKGLGKNAGASLAGAGAGIAANYLGQGISSLMGDSRLGQAIGSGVATGLGTLGGAFASKLFSKAGSINPYALGASVLGSAIGAAAGPSKEYAGKYGNITQTMDTIYDIASVGVNAIPGAGLIISGAMALNKGLSNIFGSTDGMTKTDAILGSAFMPAPVKWLNMWGSSKTGTFNNLSWQNSEKTSKFMQDGFGNLQSRFDLAREEAGKTYGTFSLGAKRDALRNIDYANRAWTKVLSMADLNTLQNIKSQDMSSINNLRYAKMILGGSDPRTLIGRQGMKILNNATNHNIGMRLLSGAALIDNKQMILSALGGIKTSRPKPKPHRRGEKDEELEQYLKEAKERVYQLLKEAVDKRNDDSKHYSNLATDIAETIQQNALFEPVTQESLQNSNIEQLKRELRKDRDEYLNNGDKFIKAAGFADLGVNVVAPLLQRGFRWAFNKAGLLIKVPILNFTTARSIYNEANLTPIETLQATGKGIADVYKAYKPGGVWYERQLLNGVPKEEIDKLANEYLNNLKNTTFDIGTTGSSDAVAVTGGQVINGKFIPKITMDPAYSKSYELVKEAATHEGGHASTLNLEPKNSSFRETEHEGFYRMVEESNPNIKKSMEYNETLRPEIKESALDEVLLDETGAAEKHLYNVIPQQELRQRALTAEIDAANKGVTMEEYISNPELWNNNFKLLMEIFEESGIRNYMQHFKSLTPITVGSSTAATLYNVNK